MLDWKYGMFQTLVRIPLVLGWIFLFYFQGKIWTALGLILIAVFFLLSILSFDKIFSCHGKENARSSTLKHFPVFFRISVTLLFFILVWLFPDNSNNNFWFSLGFPIFAVICNVVPTFYTKPKVSR